MKTILTFFASLQPSSEQGSASPLLHNVSFMDENDEPELPEKLRLKLAIKLRSGMQVSVQWITVSDVSFQGLVESVKPYIIEAHEENGECDDIEETGYVMAFKASAAGLGTAIKSDEDFACFCEEYMEYSKKKKTVFLNVTMLQNHNSQQKTKQNKKRVSRFHSL